MQSAHEAKTMTIAEAAKLLRLGKNQTYEAARSGQLPTIRIGKRILVLTEPLKRLLGVSEDAREHNRQRADQFRR